MNEAWLTARDRLVYAGGFVAAALVIYAIHFTSHDGDSALYAAISSHTVSEPVRHWVAPQWWALWPGSTVDELFVEHPAGLFWLPALLGRAGLPAGPSAYVVGVASSLGALLGLAALVNRIAGRSAARALLILLPWIPVAFIFRIRANHEYPMLLCLVVALVAVDRVRVSWAWLAALCAAVSAALVIKGVFVVFVVGAAGLWILVNPAGDQIRRACLALFGALAAGAVTALGYDRWYAAVTGHGFWRTYWARQLGPVTMASPLSQAGILLAHLRFYIVHLSWHSAPWILVAIWIGCRPLWRAHYPRLGPTLTRTLIFVGLFVGGSLLVLSVPSRVAERYTFSAAFLVSTGGILLALRAWPRLGAFIERADARVPALPALIWTLLVLGRGALGSS